MSNNSTKILIFTTAFRPFIGGSEIAIEEIAKRLPDIDFDILTPRYTRKLAREEVLGNLHVRRVGWGMLSDKIFFPISGFLKACQLLRAHQYRIIHAYQASYGAGAAQLLKLFNPQLKFILTLQEGKNLEQQSFSINFLRKIIIKNADLITAISHYLKNYTKNLNKKSKIVVIPNGVDIECFSKDYSYGELSSVADSLGIKPGEKVMISVSRLVFKNGIDDLIRAFARISKSTADNYKLLLVGDGEMKPQLQSLSKKLGIFDNIIFAGSISHADLPKYLKISDIFVRPSRSEGLGIAFLEAMAAGIPIIATKVGGIPDFLKDKETGLFAEAGNQEDLAEKIKLILSDDDLSVRLTKNAKNLVAEKYNWNIVAQQFRELYDN